MEEKTLNKICENLRFLSTHNKNYNKTQYYTILDTLEIVENQIKYNRIIELLDLNEIAYKKLNDKIYSTIFQESKEKILEKLTFNSLEEKHDFSNMSDTFTDYEIYKTTVLRIANRLLIIKE